MRIFNATEKRAFELRRPPVQAKPIQYWIAIQCGQIVGANNSIAILRHQFKGFNQVTFKSVR